MNCREEFVRIPSAGLELAGVLHLPIGATKPKPVLFLHGFTGNKIEAGRMYTDMVRVLCAAGYAALRFNFRCHGDPHYLSRNIAYHMPLKMPKTQPTS
jgi:predicted alpha/beta-fold hydrolase